MMRRMRWASAALLPLATGASATPPMPAPDLFAQLIVREQIMVRVPVRARRMISTPGPRIAWKEGKGPKCVAAGTIVGASLLGQDSVDLLLRDQTRVRAKLENSCPALDYYLGFYIRPNPDGMICADRDMLRSRMGGQCEIDKFRKLRPVVKD